MVQKHIIYSVPRTYPRSIPYIQAKILLCRYSLPFLWKHREVSMKKKKKTGNKYPNRNQTKCLEWVNSLTMKSYAVIKNDTVGEILNTWISWSSPITNYFSWVCPNLWERRQLHPHFPSSSSYLAEWENRMAGSEPGSCRPHQQGGRLR